MPNRLSKLFTRSDKEKEAEAEAERNASGSSPPPSYSQQPPDYDAEDVLDPPDITAGFSNLKLDPTTELVPTVDQCIAHLKVLECFYRLRREVGSTDGAFGIDDKVVKDRGTVPDDKVGELLAKLAEKRWAVYVSRAVDRFDRWVEMIQPGAQAISREKLEKIGKLGKLCDPSNSKPPLKFDPSNAPPVDVLMVWHAYMLNPRSYLEDCLRFGRMQMWHTGMPWKMASDCINSETFEYDATAEARERFTRWTGLSWHNLDDFSAKRLRCPVCRSEIDVEWTTCTSHSPTGTTKDLGTLASSIDDMLSAGQGFCDRGFYSSCHRCKTEITHESLKAMKFRNDVLKLVTHDVPMGGTLLGTAGIPFKHASVDDLSASLVLNTPNNLLRGTLRRKILGQEDLNGYGMNQSMSGVRDLVEEAMKDRSYMRSVRRSIGRLSRAERVGIRRMMSRYWENSSPFALDLVGAVIRQGTFIEKMHNIDWLHSPALPSTMERLLIKYQRFVTIMSDRLHMAVPTLDVDLGWHTHQLNPPAYMTYTVGVTRQFIDHDDKVAETKLNEAFEWTSKTYQKLYDAPYSACTCWYCEAVRESHTSAASRLFNTSSRETNALPHDVDQDPAKSVHISTHNAVRPTDDRQYELDAKSKADKLEKQYQKACERARKKGRREPRRNDYYYSDAWGHPVYIPAYSPYIGYMPFIPLYYSVPPGCMALSSGAAGNCCSGTCGGAVAAGGCGSSGNVGCAGGAAGGCGAGAFGGGGCGGGGGGGCGGGGGGGCGGGGGG